MINNFPIRAASEADFQSGVRPPHSKTRILIPNLVGSLWIIALCGMAAAQFISADTYTRYELLAPETHQFKIYYEVTETIRVTTPKAIRSFSSARWGYRVTA